MELIRGGDAVMNLIGLILIAVLSAGIVAVSLRLRASSSRLSFEGGLLPPEDELSKKHASMAAAGRAIGNRSLKPDRGLTVG